MNILWIPIFVLTGGFFYLYNICFRLYKTLTTTDEVIKANRAMINHCRELMKIDFKTSEAMLVRIERLEKDIKSLKISTDKELATRMYRHGGMTDENA